jgi:hypothetical protein
MAPPLFLVSLFLFYLFFKKEEDLHSLCCMYVHDLHSSSCRYITYIHACLPGEAYND